MSTHVLAPRLFGVRNDPVHGDPGGSVTSSALVLAGCLSFTLSALGRRVSLARPWASPPVSETVSLPERQS